jgi:cytochrome c oxidase subunit IV
VVGVAMQAVWSDSDLAYSISVAPLLGVVLFTIAAYVEILRQRRRH